MLAKILRGTRVFAAWLLASGLALLVLIAGRELYMLFMIVTLQVSHWSYSFLSNVYYVIAGGVWLVFFIFIDDHFNKGADKGRLLKRTLRVVGIELLLMFLITLGLLGYSYLQAGLATVGVAILEGLLSAGMLYVVKKGMPRFKTRA